MLDAQGLQFLPNYRVAARILARGEALRPFVLHTEAPPLSRTAGRRRVRAGVTAFN